MRFWCNRKLIESIEEVGADGVVGNEAIVNYAVFEKHLKDFEVVLFGEFVVIIWLVNEDCFAAMFMNEAHRFGIAVTVANIGYVFAIVIVATVTV